MCSILLPINPEYVERILDGTKRYEYRKTRCRRTDIDRMLIYSTSPVKAVVAEVEVKDIIIDDPSTLWSRTKTFAGVEKAFFDRYYHGKKTAVAYKLGVVKEYKEPMSLQDIGIGFFPQSLVYLD